VINFQKQMKAYLDTGKRSYGNMMEIAELADREITNIEYKYYAYRTGLKHRIAEQEREIDELKEQLNHIQEV